MLHKHAMIYDLAASSPNLDPFLHNCLCYIHTIIVATFYFLGAKHYASYVTYIVCTILRTIRQGRYIKQIPGFSHCVHSLFIP